jgi:hypothetical protein
MCFIDISFAEIQMLCLTICISIHNSCEWKFELKKLLNDVEF